MTNIPFNQCHEVFRKRICQLYFGGSYEGPGATPCTLCHKFPECEKMTRDALIYVGLSPQGEQEDRAV